MFETQTLDRGDDGSIRLYTAMPDEAPKAIIHILHGLAEHAARYAPFAGFLTARGYGVYTHDHRGHGPLAQADQTLGLFAETGGGDLVIADVARVNGHISSQHPGVPIFQFGHSMGATIALNYALRHTGTLAGAAVWNTGADYGLPGMVASGLLACERSVKGALAPSGVMRAATFDAWNRQFKPNRTTHDWLSSVDGEVDAYVADPLCGFPVSIAMWQDILAWIRQNRDGSALAAMPKPFPVYLVGGGKDPATNSGKAVTTLASMMQGAGMTNVQKIIYPAARHETLNDACREQAMDAFADWIDHALV